MSNKLLDLYKSVIATAWWKADDEGYVSLVRAGDKEPILIRDKKQDKDMRLVLHTDFQLKQSGTETIVFHPLFEYLTRSESDVMIEFRRSVTERLHLTYLSMAQKLLELAATSPERMTLLTPEQSEFLSAVPDADATMVETFEKLIAACPLGQNQRVFCSMFVKRGGTLMGKSNQRAAVVTFPLYHQLVADGKAREEAKAARKAKPKKEGEKADKQPPIPNETYGVSLRDKDRESFIKLFEYMVPQINVEHAYSAGSNSNIAPTIDAVMHAVQNLAGPVNDLVERFRDRLGAAADLLRVEDGWVPDFVNLAPLQVEIKKVPMQAGNEGGIASANAAPAGNQAAIEAEAVGTTSAPAAVATGAPAAQAEPADDDSAPVGFRLPPKTITQQPTPPASRPPYVPPSHAAAGHPPQGYPAHPGGYPTYPGAAPAGYPAYPNQQQQPAPRPVNTGNGVDFRAAMAANPAFAAAAMASAPQMYQAGMQQQQQDERPGWDQPGYGTQRQAGMPGGYNPRMGGGSGGSF
jgi:hypothetical protein